MNKLILVGNGFDLAHGLPTSYKCFLNDFWKNIHLNLEKEEYQNLLFLNHDYLEIFNFKKETENFKDFESNLISFQNEHSNELEGYINFELKLRKNLNIIFKFKNHFFQIINSKNSIENWVDIENEYYLQLKKITKLNFGNNNEDDLKKQRRLQIIKLNNEFEAVKNLLKKYLIERVNEVYDFTKTKNTTELAKILKIFDSNNFFQIHGDYKYQLQNYSKEFSYQKDRNEILKVYEDLGMNPYRKNITFNTLFLDFNYTSTIPFYQELLKDRAMKYSINKIHGDLYSMIFGFGDEMDEDYQLIENIDDNEYLEFFKSFQYFQNNNYDQLLSTIDSQKFQVIVLGHSCGLSDRVMLNTIFEHENCRSIKIYYHKKEDGTDNYLDVVKNISRHFKDKPSMRRKIVSKELSSHLPQNVRFQKK
ncbi:bacteriophage abortive infection AbiH family protein [Polaribacter undariae]|uniref:Bacteriophage abortive infection AbiH family protein n=1 Tax=Polaribacter sejongensis TaxID=985043 RepID=A0AAJ1QU91_9FLAO|nr:bacteriophage abortive infection AbiH family protein [Polaribacter undariae]MDN3618383.1 bacteriophage abortive infection AbiH family protein [Polaribacter undariae]UWD30633.1 bacteriophage abortive infection AbiH family protein [Polaribacter undariae]